MTTGRTTPLTMAEATAIQMEAYRLYREDQKRIEELSRARRAEREPQDVSEAAPTVPPGAFIRDRPKVQLPD